MNEDIARYKKIYENTAKLNILPMQANEIIQSMEYITNNIGSRENGFIEIGSGFDGSFYCWASIFNGPAISIDLPWIIGVNDVATKHRNNTWANEFGERVHIIESDSMNLEITHDKLNTILGTSKVDFLFIDATHDYVPTYNDFHNYKQYVRPGGMIAFHDIYHHAHQDGCAKVFNEVEGTKFKTNPDMWLSYEPEEMLDGPGWAGIGIVHV